MFAAYSGDRDDEASSRDFQKQDVSCSDKWLNNSSFPTCSSALSTHESDTFPPVKQTQVHVGQGGEDADIVFLGHSRNEYQDSSSSSEFDSDSSSASYSRKRKKRRSRSRESKHSSKKERHTSSKRSRERAKKHSRNKSYSRSPSPHKKKHISKSEKYRSRKSIDLNKRRHEDKHRSSSSSSDREAENESRKNIQCGSRPYYEDRDRDFGNMKVSTLSRPSVAWYHQSKEILGCTKPYYSKRISIKKTLKHRYYNRVLKLLEKELEQSGPKMISKNDAGDTVSADSHQVEEELSRITAKFNSDIASEPHNVTLWLEYVKFQDIVHQFELTHRRGGGAAGIRVTAERKLSILDKALEENPSNTMLLRERCQLAETVLPGDRLSSELKSWVSKDPGNLILWKSLIMASQGSLSSCRVPDVKSLYQAALSNIHGLRRSNSTPLVLLESKIIEIILHLGLFLRQSGLMELMWSLFHVYLEFNLAKLDSSKFNISSTVADNALLELEETILGSQMPLPTLWLRIETLRSGTHWVSLPADSECEDPQRMVFPEDINDFIQPITTPNLTFRLVTITLVLLKVPLLPWRQSAAEAAGLHPLPWLLDGPEPLFASLLPLGTLEFRETSVLLSDAAQLANGPQFLIARPGQDEYIDFLIQVFSACSQCLEPVYRTYVLVWWLRFYRWLIQLDRLGHCKLPPNRKKTMRSSAKELLRQDCNRSNLLLFKEFALLEWECNNLDSAKKVLQGAITAQPSSKPVPFSNERSALCALYRTFVELCLSHTQPEESKVEASQKAEIGRATFERDREKALLLLTSLGRGIPLTERKVSNIDIAAALTKFDHISRELFVKPLECEGDFPLSADVCHVAPSFLVEWSTCYGWLLYLSDSVWKASEIFENFLSCIKSINEAGDLDQTPNTSESPPSLVKVQREAIFEGYVSILRHHCHRTCGSFNALRKVLLRGLDEFPANMTLLAAFADLESTVIGSGLPSWRLSKIFIEFNSAASYAFLVFEMRHRLKQQEILARNADAFHHRGGPEISNNFIRTRMDTLLKKLTKHPVMRRCPLLWRLRLQFAAAFSIKETDYQSTFYLALEDCPWAKALYLDIVQVLPMQLGQIQDLLIEKELRLHVTPEELEILRKDT